MRHDPGILQREHWIFDLDGTLTVALHDFPRIREVLGIPEGVDILKHLDCLPEVDAAPLKRKLEAIEDDIAARTEPAQGALLLVEQLASRGARLGVLTRNTRAAALMTLERIGLSRFIAGENVLGREDACAKPDPDGILQLAQRWGVHPSQTVMVGDYCFDLQCGRAAGAATVHVDVSRSFRWPELCDVAVGSLEELALALDGFRFNPR